MADSTLVLSSPGAMTSPYPEAPKYTPPRPADITSNLLVAYEAAGLPAGVIGSWPQTAGSLTAGPLMPSTNRPIAEAGVLNGQTVARFTAANANYLRVLPFSGGGTIPAPATQAILARAATVATTMNLTTGGTSGGASRYLATGIDGNTGKVQLGGGVVGELKSSDPVIAGTWYVIISVFDGTNSHIYMNGKLVGSGPVGVNSAANAYLPGLTVGANTGTNTQYFDGDISKISIYGRAFTSTDAVALTADWRRAANLA